MKQDYVEPEVEDEEVVKEKVKKGPVAKKEEKKNVADLSKNTVRTDR